MNNLTQSTILNVYIIVYGCPYLGEIPVQLPEVEEGEGDADEVNGDPEHVEHVVAVGSVHERARRCAGPAVRARRQRAR